MKQHIFEQVLLSRIAKTKEVLGSKSKEYSSDEDKLHNFKRAARMLGCTPEQALIGFMTKHVISILDMVDGLAKGKTYPIGVWSEKLGDNINYNILLEALVQERFNEEVDRNLQNEEYCERRI